VVRYVASTVVLLLFGAVATVRAQAVNGRVLDAADSTLVAGVRVRLFNAAGTRMGEAITDSAGAFHIAGRGPGRYTLTVEHIAYVAFRSAPFELPYMETVSVDVRISRTAIPLEPIAVTARRRQNYHAPTYDGLYARMEQLPAVGSNRIVMKGDIEFRSVLRARELLDQFFYTVVRNGRGVCLVWNGMPVHPLVADLRLDAHVDDLEAVEVYGDPLMAPMEWRDPMVGLSSTCSAVVALWSLRPDLPGRKRAGGV
jgi:hypothetical protein